MYIIIIIISIIIIIIIIMYLIHKFQQTMEYISIYLQYVQVTRNNGNLKDILYYNNVSKKEVDLAENWIPYLWFFTKMNTIDFVGLDGVIKGLYSIIRKRI